MAKLLKNILKISVSLALGIFIFWLAYRKMDTKQIFEVLKGNVHYEFIWMSVILGILANLFRGLRWKILIDALGEKKVTRTNAFCAVSISYFVNFLFPRAGEVVRCGVITRYHQISFTKVIGTMLAERAFDVIVLLLLIVFAFLLQMHFFSVFIAKNVSISFSFFHTFLWIFSILFVVSIVIYLLRKKINKLLIYKQIFGLFKDVLHGVKTSLRLKNKSWFFFHTFGIWFCYFLMLYLPIYAFDFSSHLSVYSVLFIFVMGSLGTIVPVQGGIGTWHFMTILAMGLYGIGGVQAGAFALIVHGAQMFSYMFGGIVAFIVLPFVNKTNV